MDSQSPSAGARPITHTTTPPARKLPDIHLDIVLVVFCGGAIGTAIRYAFAQIPAAGSFHTGTFVANMLACFCYAGLTAYLAGASRFGARSKELASRGLGMGVCGGLSTMSTLALEGFTAIRDGQVAAGIAYLLVTFALGLVCASAGASCRYLLDVTIKTYWQRAFPLSTFTINLIAGFLAGLVAALALGGTLDEPWRLVLATGFLGGFSTFSTAINEMVTLFRKHRYPTAAAYLVLSLGVPVVAAACGFLV